MVGVSGDVIQLGMLLRKGKRRKKVSFLGGLLVLVFL
jgi:hypothetical protein